MSSMHFRSDFDPLHDRYSMATLELVLDHIHLHALDHPDGYAGKAGSTDMVVLAALIDKARTLHRLTFGMASREVAELAGTRRQTASASLVRLRDRGTILISKRTHPSPPMIDILIPHCPHDPAEEGPLACPVLESHKSTNQSDRRIEYVHTLLHTDKELIGSLVRQSTLVSHDIFAGMKPLAQVVFSALDQPRTAANLIEMTGKSKATIYRVLNELKQCDLVIQGPAGYLRCSLESLDDAARGLGVDGVAARRRELHQHEREELRKSQEVYKSRGGTHQA